MSIAMVDELEKEVKRETKRKQPSVDLAAKNQSKSEKKDPSAYYDSDQGKYYMRNDRMSWIQVSETSIKRFLALEVYNNLSKLEGQDKAMARHLLNMQKTLDVEYAGPLAGFNAGLHIVCNNRILATKSPFIIKAYAGKWNTLKLFIDELLGKQADYFHAWVKAARASMKQGTPFRPGQMLCLAGPPGCGKSVLQGLITLMLGGRSAHPFRYMIGDTKFNSDLFYAEHLMIEDEAASTSIQVRRDFGSKMKAMIVNQTQSFHRKTKEAVSLTPFWRLTVSLNDEAENLMVLPVMDNSIKDKIILLKASQATFPGEEAAHGAFAQFLMGMQMELPAYHAWLSSWRVPAAIQNRRFGVIAYQHPDLLEALEDMAPEVRLLNFIDQLKPGTSWPTEWQGTASDLEAILIERDKTGRVQRTLTFPTACGVYLARLKHRYPDRVQTVGRSTWKILGPKIEREEEPIPS